MTGDNREPPEEGVFLKLNEAEGVSEKNLTSGRRSPVEIRCVNSDSSSRGPSSSLSSSSSSLVPSSDSDAVVGVGGGGGSKGPRHAAVSVIGRRREMEDAVTIAPGFSEGYDFYGVYDGHGGARVAHVCRERMHVVLAEEVGLWGEEGEEWREAMAACFARVDGEVAAESPEAEEWTVGSTAIVAVVSPKRIVVANCGDSRAVLSRAGVAIPLSNDHKPERADELERVEAAGGRVINWNGYRILGVLATSRSIGDCYLKPYVISEPEVMVIDRNKKDEFIILASDGLWDVVSNEVACRVARQFLSGRAARIFPEAVSECSAAEAAGLLVELALSRGSRDNISVVVVELKRLLRNRTSRGSS